MVSEWFGLSSRVGGAENSLREVPTAVTDMWATSTTVQLFEEIS